MEVASWFEGIKAKLERAGTHLEVIKEEITQFNASDPYEFFTEQEPDTGYTLAKARLKEEPDFALWAVIIGDCVHNLRSALDHTAHVLLDIEEITPMVGRGGTAFPILDTTTGPNGGPREVRIVGVGGQVTGNVLAFVKGVQPYNRLDGPEEHPLWILSELDNMDKHRALTFASAALQDFGLGFNPVDYDLYIDHTGITGPFDEHTELARFLATPRGPNAHMEMYPKGSTDVAFDATSGPAAQRLVLTTLDELQNYVTCVIEILLIKALRQAGVPGAP